MTEILSALLGGALIGVAASGLMYYLGRIAGISGIFHGVLNPKAGDTVWRLSFILGLLAGGVALANLVPSTIGAPVVTNPATIAAAGLLVGVGTRLGNGCTSGHGVCGIARRSRRSLVATMTFVLSGVVVATLTSLLSGGV